MVIEGRRLITQAAAHGITLRLLGGVAIWLRAGDAARGLFGRSYPDLDFVVHKKQSRAFRSFLEESGYLPERTFNAMHGATRLLYHSPDGGFQVDVFLDIFKMCHVLDLGERLEVEDLTVPVAELILTKLQIAEINRKDVGDVLMLLYDHEPADVDGASRLNVARLQTLCGADWGLFTTITDNLAKARELISEFVSDETVANSLRQRIDEIQGRLEVAPKTAAWKMRARIGRRKRWYELPEHVTR